MCIEKIFDFLKKELGDTKAIVKDSDPFKVLISTVLSQRTRDENTATASKKLFSKLPTPKKIANASPKEIEELIKQSGFYKIKAKYVRDISKLILDKYKGKVPDDMEELLSLPGVGRKTANCVLVYAFNKSAIPVDVHVNRISNRLGLVKTTDPEKTEEELSKILPRKYWIPINELMVKFGQRKCLPINPKCEECSLNRICEYGKKRVG